MITEDLIKMIKNALSLTGKNFLLFQDGVAFLDEDLSTDAIDILSRIALCENCTDAELCFKHANFLISYCTNQRYIEKFWSLYGMVRMYVAWERSVDSHEFAIHRLVKDKINEVTDGRYQIISMKSDGRNIQDLWVKDTSSDKILPVEIKKKAFDAHAQKQLERYISSYDSGQGIAVGESYTAASNPNIIFMPISMFR